MRGIVALAALLGGCASLSPYEQIGTRRAEPGYRKIELFVHGSGGASGDMPVAIFIKAFPSNGRLALCGYYMASGGGAMTDLLAQMLSSNGSVLRLADETIGNLSFLYPNAMKASATDATANCVLARPAWKPGYATGRLEISAPSARMPG
jgi:hypothetical protein